jgi:hypothetical protein
MAEKASSQYCYVVALTYGSDTQEKRDGAAVFRYKDIKDLMKRIRRQAEYRHGKTASLSYIVAGEQGSLRERVHWHAVLFSTFDLLSLGDWSSFVSKKPITRKEQKITTDPNHEKRVTWSHWPWGLIVVQIPDQGGMMYALKYALKDQFNVEKSKGTMREHKAEAWGSGFFRMSKKPPIGSAFISAKLARLRELGAVLPSLKIKIPDYKGYLFPAGFLQKQVVEGFKVINRESIELHGRNVPQWGSLLRSVEKQPKIWMDLQDESPEIEDDQQWSDRKRVNARESIQTSANASIRTRCGGIYPCTACNRSRDDEWIGTSFRPFFDAVLKDARNSEGWSKYLGSKRNAKKPVVAAIADYADHFQRGRRVCNPFCQQRDHVAVERAFRKGF